MMQQIKDTYYIKTFDVGPMQNMIYLIIDRNTKYTAIIDPAWELKEVHQYISENDLMKLIMKNENLKKYIIEENIKKKIFIQNKLINIII